MTFMTIAQSIAEQAEQLEARADSMQRELDRVCIERANERNRADAAELERERLRAEVARLTVAKLPTAADYDRLIKERNDARADLGIARGNVETLREKVEALSSAWHKHRAEIAEQCARADKAEAEVARLTAAAESMVVDYGQMQIKVDEALKEAAYWADFAQRVVPEAARQKCADYDEYRMHVDAAFKTLGVRENESFEGCAARVMGDLAEIAARRDHWIRVRTEAEERAREANRQRDAARAELARVREALGTLVSNVTCEGKKGGGS